MGKGVVPILSSSQQKLGSLSARDTTAAMSGWVYILCNKPQGVLYVGVTGDLPARMMQHRAGTGSAYCRRYGIKRLVLTEEYAGIEAAIAREKAIKAWKRQWKIELIQAANPGWDDLFDVILR